MGEVLEVGSEAETCQMAGRGMNGLRGIVVCYNASNARYTLELDSGEMMSLRARNVKPCMAESPEEEEEVQVEEPEPPVVKKKKAPPSYLPKYSNNTMNDQDVPTAEDNKPPQQGGGGNIVDRFLYSIFGFIFDMSPSVLLLAIMAGYYANKFWTGWFFADEFGNDNDSTNDDDDGTTNKSDADDASSTPSSSPTRQRHRRDGYYDEYGYYHDYDYYYHRPYYRRRWYHWNYWGGGPHWWYWWGWYGVSGLFSVLIVAFFIYQFGTKQGKTDFSWRHVKERVLAFSFWDVMMYASLLEGAFLFLTRVAQQAAAGRGGGGGGRRR